MAWVRDDCSDIIEAKKEVNWKERFGASQNIGCRTKITLIFINQNKGDEIEKIDLVAGSKVEKISTIIRVI